MRSKFFLTITALVLATFACSSTSSEWLPEQKSEPAGSIVYQMNQDGNFELYKLDLSANESVKLTNNTAQDISPTYIAASGRIGFVSDRSGTGLNIYEMDLNGVVSDALFKKNLIVDYPIWSPDGKKIVASMCAEFASTDEQCLYDIYILDPLGPVFKKLTATPDASEWVPVWSPDGRQIVFSSDRDGDSEVYVINASGNGLVQLTKNKNYDGRPHWSPDGSQIAFESDREGDWDIFIMNADGSNPQGLTVNASASDWQPSWSPDGKWLVYTSTSAGGEEELYIVRADGTDQRRLTTNSIKEFSPVWLP